LNFNSERQSQRQCRGGQAARVRVIVSSNGWEATAFRRSLGRADADAGGRIIRWPAPRYGALGCAQRGRMLMLAGRDRLAATDGN